MRNLKRFQTHAEYEAAESSLILPNVSICKDTPNEVHYNPYVEPMVAKFNVVSTTNPTKILSQTSDFSSIEIDGVEQPSVTTEYTFSSTGEHTVKYTLTNPTNISDYAFGGCKNLISITIPNSVTSIGSQVFSNCISLTSITIPDSVTNLGYSAFAYCSGMTSCTIGNGVTSIGNTTFAYCSGLTSVTIGNSVTSIGNGSFSNCKNLTSITIPSSVTSIGTFVFNNCYNLASIISLALTAPTIESSTFENIKSNGTLYVPIGSSGYDTWMNYLGNNYNWTKVEQ